MEDSGQDRQSFIGDPDDANIGFDGGKGVVGSQDLVLRQGVEERGFTHVWQADDSDREAHEE